MLPTNTDTDTAMCSETRSTPGSSGAARARSRDKKGAAFVRPAREHMLTSQKHPEFPCRHDMVRASPEKPGSFLLRRRERGTPDMAKRLARSSFLARKQSNGYTSTAGGKTHKSSENSKLIFSPQIRRLRASGREAAA